MDDVSNQFIMLTCQVGAEPAVKSELARKWPALRLAFSRPGFLTFKLPKGHGLPDDFDLHSIFARAYAFSLGKVVGTDMAEMASHVWRLVGERDIRAVHVWERDRYTPGHRGYEPGLGELSGQAREQITLAAPAEAQPRLRATAEHGARSGDTVLDCVMVEPGEWWIGYHRARVIASRWPGGFFPLELPAEAVSRAWLKAQEAAAWSQFPFAEGDRLVELGSSPGGASQAFLGFGLQVIGVDPAKMHADVLAHPNFEHWQKRGADVKRREYAGIRWLAADMNVAPAYTLDTVESIVKHPNVNLAGLLLTLKLLEWELADTLPEILDRIRSWGYTDVRARQLHHNRQEICVAALRDRSLRRPRLGKAAGKKSGPRRKPRPAPQSQSHRAAKGPARHAAQRNVPE